MSHNDTLLAHCNENQMLQSNASSVTSPWLPACLPPSLHLLTSAMNSFASSSSSWAPKRIASDLTIVSAHTSLPVRGGRGGEGRGGEGALERAGRMSMALTNVTTARTGEDVLQNLSHRTNGGISMRPLRPPVGWFVVCRSGQGGTRTPRTAQQPGGGVYRVAAEEPLLSVEACQAAQPTCWLATCLKVQQPAANHAVTLPGRYLPTR